ncbi:MAG: lysophospholipid acyltransferase family protein [Oleiphilaceae bacterium]|nr:lysophospholipid acyltransferase family protein [Oleiphilaceae bacterium]
MTQHAAENSLNPRFLAGPLATLGFVTRAFLFVVYLLFGLLLALAIGAFWVQNKPWQKPAIHAYCVGLCRLLRLRIRVTGAPPPGAALVVGNHISWLDIPVLFATLAGSRFLAKSEVRQWPLVGALGVAAGTLFMRRDGHPTRAINHQIRQQLQQGFPVVVFPEGTTSDGAGVLPFHGKLFGAPLSTGLPVQPVLLRYRSQGRRSRVAPFIGDEGFYSHLARILAGEPLTVEVHWLPALPVPCVEDSMAEESEPWKARKTELAERARQQITEALQQADD